MDVFELRCPASRPRDIAGRPVTETPSLCTNRHGKTCPLRCTHRQPIYTHPHPYPLRAPCPSRHELASIAHSGSEVMRALTTRRPLPQRGPLGWARGRRGNPHRSWGEGINSERTHFAAMTMVSDSRGTNRGPSSPTHSRAGLNRYPALSPRTDWVEGRGGYLSGWQPTFGPVMIPFPFSS